MPFSDAELLPDVELSDVELPPDAELPDAELPPDGLPDPEPSAVPLPDVLPDVPLPDVVCVLSVV